MRKLSFILFLFLVVFVNCEKDDEMEVDVVEVPEYFLRFEKTINFEGIIESMVCFTKTDDFGYMLGGTFEGDMGFMKVDSLGDLLWAYKFDFRDGCQDILKTSDGNYILLGYWSLIKVDKQGNVIWSNIMEPSGLVNLDAIAQIDENYILVTGYKHSDLWFCIYDKEGNLVYEHFIDSGEREHCNFILKEDDNTFTLLGTYGVERNDANLWILNIEICFDTNCDIIINRDIKIESDKTVYPFPVRIFNTSDNSYMIASWSAIYDLYPRHEIRMTKINHVGEILYDNYYSASISEQILSIDQSLTGEYYLTGYRSYRYSSKLLVLKLDTECNLIYRKLYEIPDYYLGYDLMGRDILCTDDGGFIVLGHKSHTYGNDDEEISGIWLLKCDPDGEYIDSTSIDTVSMILPKTIK